MITGIHHVALLTREDTFREVIKLYTDVLGLMTVRSWSKGIMISTGDNSVLEIMVNDTIDNKAIGVFQHIAFSCDEVDECYKLLLENGCESITPPTDITIDCEKPYPVRICFVLGLGGETIELFCEK